MRTLLFSALCFLFFSTAQAQTEKGRWLVGGAGTAYFDTGNDEAKQTILIFSPGAGYFVARNLAVGASVPLVYAHSKVGSNFESTSAAFGLAPFVRGYFGQSSTFKPYLQGQLGYIVSSNKVSGFGPDEAESRGAFIYGAAAGLAFFLNEHSSFDVALAYTGGDRNGDSSGLFLVGTYPKTISLGVGFQLFLGKAK